MSDEAGTVNSQIIDATSGVVTLLTGQAPSQSFGLLDVVMAETLGMVMYNAVNRQQSASAIGSAAVTAACARMLSAQSAVPSPPPEPPTPPHVVPLPGPAPDPAPDVAVAAAYAGGELAVGILRAQAASAAATSQTAQADLDNLIIQAGGTPPKPTTETVDPPHWDTRLKQLVADAREAIDTLLRRAGDPNTGRAELDTLITEAGGAPPPTPRAIRMKAASPGPEVAEAFAAARSAVGELRTLVVRGAPTRSQAARSVLDRIITHAGGTPPEPLEV